MGLQKKYLKSKPMCKVTFTVPKEAAGNAQKIHLVGDFNNWKQKSLPLKKLKNGSFKITVDLPCGRDYQYRYLLDNTTWLNDWEADKYVPSSYSDAENSVVTVSADPEK
ncbi:MAG: isoamylase early set domain-containing protein [Desulfobulbaceae bacterium]|nr:isoamylase early set domain-containing protein [Desulfobulbaceae bacterium]